MNKMILPILCCLQLLFLSSDAYANDGGILYLVNDVQPFSSADTRVLVNKDGQALGD
ncbi:hypothetical protein KP003_05300 [Geomonas nitrogeniifigens]|uniref:hypothetical protein n=1 Tax=Geomonas diazotrophica TaxID=2843197 RepID=UPI001C2B7803|nr:hypothetical protein [Geomonas nitrogeniifigens]QXE87821.1 hypothetical protein KP003_05300 [Geomonas nitrogeniifigens]